MRKNLLLFFLVLSVSAFAQELPDRLKIKMVYAGGYSPLAKAEIQIVKEDKKIVYSVKKEYYEEAPSQKEGSLDPQRLETLLKVLESNDIWTLKDLEEYPATDGFTYTIEIGIDEKIHHFKVYFPELQKDTRYRSIIDEINKVIGE